MFTGLIEAIGEVTAVSPSAAGSRLQVATALDAELTPGDSLAVNGVCLTVVTAAAGAGLQMDVAPITGRITTMGAVKPGTVLNLERSLAAGARLGGHFVQGHVDATTKLIDWQAEGEGSRLRFAMPKDVARYIVVRGFIALDGVSLTVARLAKTFFEVAILPRAAERTTLGSLRPGGAVNVEVDIVARYVEGLVRRK
jgi:riboflavin synthase